MEQVEAKERYSQLEEIDQAIAYQDFCLRVEREKTKKTQGRIRSTSATRYHVDQIKELKEKREALIKNSRQAWQEEHERILLEDIQRLEERKFWTSF